MRHIEYYKCWLGTLIIIVLGFLISSALSELLLKMTRLGRSIKSKVSKVISKKGGYLYCQK